jgi:hypothetical protein
MRLRERVTTGTFFSTRGKARKNRRPANKMRERLSPMKDRHLI